jgi:hypothetical protein
MRVPRAQAALIIRQELIQQGMLTIQHDPQEPRSTHEIESGAQS